MIYDATDEWDHVYRVFEAVADKLDKTELLAGDNHTGNTVAHQEQIEYRKHLSPIVMAIAYTLKDIERVDTDGQSYPFDVQAIRSCLFNIKLFATDACEQVGDRKPLSKNEPSYSAAKLYDAVVYKGTTFYTGKEFYDYALAHKSHVVIYRNDEAGEWQWSIMVAGTEFWLTSFPTQTEALAFVNEHGLSYEVIPS